MKLTNRELDRIDAYRAKCAENALNRGEGLGSAMKAFVHSERAAYRAVLGETRPKERGWWNSPPVVEEEFSAGKEMRCQECGEVVDVIAVCDGRWRCTTCIRKVEQARLNEPEPEYGRKRQRRESGAVNDWRRRRSVRDGEPFTWPAYLRS